MGGGFSCAPRAAAKDKAEEVQQVGRDMFGVEEGSSDHKTCVI